MKAVVTSSTARCQVLDGTVPSPAPGRTIETVVQVGAEVRTGHVTARLVLGIAPAPSSPAATP